MIAWRNKETGEWLVQSERATQTGVHLSVRFTDNIDEASILFKPDRKIKNLVEPVEVEVTRTVKIIDERHESNIVFTNSWHENIGNLSNHYSDCNFVNSNYPINECVCNCYEEQIFNLGRKAERDLFYGSDR